MFNVRYFSLFTPSLTSTHSPFSLSIRSLRVFLNRSIFLPVLLSVSDNWTLRDDDTRNWNPMPNPYPLSSLLISISSLFEDNSLVILSTEFFYLINSSMLITIPERDLMDACSHSFNVWVLDLNSDRYNSSNYDSIFVYLALSSCCIFTLNNPISTYGISLASYCMHH